MQRQRTRLSEGTPIHKEMEEELAKLHGEHSSASAALHEAKENLAHTKHALTESDSLLSECSRHRTALEQLIAEIKTMETLRDEWHAHRGLELSQLVREAVYEAKEYQRQVTESAAARLQNALALIDSELADEYPEMAQEVAEAFSEKVNEDSEENQGSVEAVEEIKEAPPVDSVSSDPTIRLMEAWLRFVDCVRQDGQAAHKNRLRGNGLPLFSIIALSEGRLHHFANPGIWQQIRRRDSDGRDFYHWSTPEFLSIEILLDKERERVRDAGWQYQRRDF